MTDVVSQPVLDRQSMAINDVTFRNTSGVPYAPSTVHKRVVAIKNDGTLHSVITDWTAIGGFSNGQDIDITATEMQIQDTTLKVERHVVQIVADRTTSTENPLRIIVPVHAKELLPAV